jgi:uncharacterized protein YktA (UPF0223 family)
MACERGLIDNAEGIRVLTTSVKETGGTVDDKEFRKYYDALKEIYPAEMLESWLIYKLQKLNGYSQAEAEKCVRDSADLFECLEAGIGIEVCKDCIEWAKKEKRTFLRQSLEAGLIALYFNTGMFSEALALGSTLQKELKKIDDKNLLVEVQLLESKAHHALSNLPNSRAALTSARATAIAINCPPKLQAALEYQNTLQMLHKSWSMQS